MSQSNFRLMETVQEQKKRQGEAVKEANRAKAASKKPKKTPDPRSARPEEMPAPQPKTVKPKKVSQGETNVNKTLQSMLHDKTGRKAAVAAAEILGEPVSKRRHAGRRHR